MLNTALFARLANKGLFSLFFTGLVKLSSLLKVSFIIGSYTAFLSMTSVMMPLSGAFGGIWGAILVCALGLGFKLTIGSAITFKFLAYSGIPGLFAGLYWGSNSWGARLIIPLICMLAFIVNPVGSQIWAYSLFWLIPMITAFFKKNIFLQSLGSTFIAHAVGTVIWIWAVPTIPAFWLMLVPIVIIERMVFALGMTFMHKALSYCYKTIGKHVWFLRLSY